MKMTQRMCLAAGLFGGLVACSDLQAQATNTQDTSRGKSRATPPKSAPGIDYRSVISLVEPGPAVSKQSRVNVRGKADIRSEVVGSLTNREPVTVLEIVVLKKPEADEPAKWARIVLPSETPV